MALPVHLEPRMNRMTEAARFVAREAQSAWAKYVRSDAGAWNQMWDLGYKQKMESRRERARHYVLSGMIADLGPSASVLDVGCGCGTMLDYLPRGVRYEGIDISRLAIDSAQRSNWGERTCSFVVSPFERYASARKFDIVVFNEVLYYFPLHRVRAVLDKARSHLAPNSHVLISMSRTAKAELVWLAARPVLPSPIRDIETRARRSRWTIRAFRLVSR